MSLILKVSSVCKSFGEYSEYSVIKDVNFTISSGEIVSLIGPSGSGKSTLLHIIGLLDHPTFGSIVINDVECTSLNDKSRTAMRLNNLGFVYQFHYLLQELTILDNIILPQIILGCKKKEAISKARDLLNLVNLRDKEYLSVSQLSGGEKQRIAIARALINSPSLLIADEPTGNLDDKTAMSIFSLLFDYAKKNKVAVLLATHNIELAKKSDTILELNSGYLVK